MFLYRRNPMNKKGQGMTEYIIIVALVAIAAIAVIGLFGGKIKAAFLNAGTQLDGGTPNASSTDDAATAKSRKMDVLQQP